MSTSVQSDKKKSFDKNFYITLVHQYLASLTSDDPFAAHVVPLSKVNPSSSTPDENIEVPPLPAFLHEQIQQIEYPNLLNPKGAASDYKTILLRAQAAKSMIAESRFEVQSVLVADPSSDKGSTSDDSAEAGSEETGVMAAIEALWTGTISKDVNEKLKRGLVLKARFAMFFEFRDGKIFRQKNYDCFDLF